MGKGLMGIILLLLRIAVTFLSELRVDVRINLAKLEPF